MPLPPPLSPAATSRCRYCQVSLLCSPAVLGEGSTVVELVMVLMVVVVSLRNWQLSHGAAKWAIQSSSI